MKGKIDVLNPEDEFLDSEFDYGIENHGVPNKIYQKIPCLIGFSYMRIEVNGDVRACCSSPINMGNIYKKPIKEIWLSMQYNMWRSKFKKIHKEHFHLKNKEFSFCQTCPHLDSNLIKNEYKKLLED